jgi:hypothetical protein
VPHHVASSPNFELKVPQIALYFIPSSSFFSLLTLKTSIPLKPYD